MKYCRMLAWLLCAMLLMSCLACGRAAEDTDTADVVPRVPYDDIRFATEEQKEAWVKPITELLNTMKQPYASVIDDGEADSYGEYLELEGIAHGYGIGLLDVTMDGVPELLVDLGGGSAGNALFAVYDIYTGEEYMTLDSGYDGGWCTYYDTEEQDFRQIGQYQFRGGWDCRYRYITKLMYDREKQSYEIESLFHTSGYLIPRPVTQTGQNGETEIVGVEYDTYIKYSVQGEKVMMDEYYHAYDEFIRTVIRIPETDMLVFHLWDLPRMNDSEDTVLEDDGSPYFSYARSEQIARELLFSGQEFIQPN